MLGGDESVTIVGNAKPGLVLLITLGAGNDNLYCYWQDAPESIVCVVEGNDGRDLIRGDRLRGGILGSGGRGNDYLVGTEADGTVCHMHGDDGIDFINLKSGLGEGFCDGGTGDDLILAGNGALPTCIGGLGNDVIFSLSQTTNATAR